MTRMPANIPYQQRDHMMPAIDVDVTSLWPATLSASFDFDKLRFLLYRP